MAAPRACGIGDEAAPRLEDQLRIHRELGLPGIELRTIDGRGLHQLTEAEAEAAAAAVIDSGLEVPVVDTPIGGWAVSIADDFDRELEILRVTARHAARIGCRQLRIMSYPNDGRPEPAWRAEALRRLRELAARAQDLGVTLLHENCHGWASQSAEHTLDLLAEVEGIGLIFDAGNGLAYGYDAVEFLRAVLPHVRHVHLKDGVVRHGNAEFCLLGDGQVALAECLGLLDEAGYTGWYSLEPHVAHIPHLGISDDPGALQAAYRTSAERLLALLALPEPAPETQSPLWVSGAGSQRVDPVRLSDDDVAWLVDLLEVPSVSPLEGGDPGEVDRAQGVFEEGARARGFATVRRDSPPPDALQRADVPLAVRQAATDPAFLAAQPSLVVAYGPPQPPERRLVINFHIDTVAPHIPPRLADRRLHGRGTVDDKGPGVAAAVGVAAAFAAAPALAERVEVQLTSVPGEEGGAMGVYGTRWLVEAGHTGRLMLFAEPTGGRVLDACSATMTPLLQVDGVDSTDDHPYDGHNATLALGFLASHLAPRLGRRAEELGAKVCVAGLHTGHAHNRVYGTGELRLNIAYFDDAAGTTLAADVEELVAEAGERFAEHFGDTALAQKLVADWDEVVGLTWLKRGLPVLANRDPAMEALLAACGLHRHDGIADGSAFTCDAIWAGGSGRYVAMCGPGRLDANGAHTATEHVDLDDLDAYATAVRDLVLRFAAHLDHLDHLDPGRQEITDDRATLIG